MGSSLASGAQRRGRATHLHIALPGASPGNPAAALSRETEWQKRQRGFCVAGWRRRGFYSGAKPVVLTKRGVDGIQLQGGTILGTSRGGADIRRA